MKFCVKSWLLHILKKILEAFSSAPTSGARRLLGHQLSREHSPNLLNEYTAFWKYIFVLQYYSLYYLELTMLFWEYNKAILISTLNELVKSLFTLYTVIVVTDMRW